MCLILGIDIGTTSVKCVVVKQLENSHEVFDIWYISINDLKTHFKILKNV